MCLPYSMIFSLHVNIPDYIYLMKGGEVKYEGSPQSTITKESMKDVYDIDCKNIMGS